MAGLVITKKPKHSYIERFLPFYSILSLYLLGETSFFTLGFVGLLLIAVLDLYHAGWKIQLNQYLKPFLMFMFFLVIRDFLRIVFGYGEALFQINIIISYVVYFCLFFIITSQNFDENKLYKAWKVCTILVGLGTVYHLYVLVILHGSVMPISIIPGVIFRESYLLHGFNRPLSFFSEPGGISASLMPMLFMALKRNDIKWATISTLIILGSTSTVGVLLSAILWCFFLVKLKVRFLKRFLYIFIGIIIVFLFIANDMFLTSYTKFQDVLAGGSTFNTRVANGFEIVGTMDFLEYIVGANYISIRDYVTDHFMSFSSNSPVIQYYILDRLFLNSISRIILYYGILGLCFYLYTFYKLYTINNYEAKLYVIITLVSAFGQSTFLNSSYFLTLIFLLLYTRKDTRFIIA